MDCIVCVCVCLCELTQYVYMSIFDAVDTLFDRFITADVQREQRQSLSIRVSSRFDQLILPLQIPHRSYDWTHTHKWMSQTLQRASTLPLSIQDLGQTNECNSWWKYVYQHYFLHYQVHNQSDLIHIGCRELAVIITHITKQPLSCWLTETILLV